MISKFDEQIISNLRQKYGEQLASVPDAVLLERFNNWNLSSKDEPELDWLLDG